MNQPASAFSDLYLFLDLETEGLDVEKDRILEVAWVITDDQMGLRLGAGSTLTHVTHPLLSSRVREMHEQSGLLAAMADGEQPHAFLWEIEREINAQLDELVGGHKPLLDHTVKVTLAGSGIDFDRRHIRKSMPNLDARLHYQFMDTSQIRRFLRDVCWIPEEEMAYNPPKGLVPHRAADDVEMAIGELKFYLYRVSDWYRVFSGVRA